MDIVPALRQGLQQPPSTVSETVGPPGVVQDCQQGCTNPQCHHPLFHCLRSDAAVPAEHGSRHVSPGNFLYEMTSGWDVCTLCDTVLASIALLTSHQLPCTIHAETCVATSTNLRCKCIMQDCDAIPCFPAIMLLCNYRGCNSLSTWSTIVFLFLKKAFMQKILFWTINLSQCTKFCN